MTSRDTFTVRRTPDTEQFVARPADNVFECEETGAGGTSLTLSRTEFIRLGEPDTLLVTVTVVASP